MQAISRPSATHRGFRLQPVREVPLSVIDDTEGLCEELEFMEHWDFDTLALLEHTQNPLLEIGFSIFSKLGLATHFSIDSTKLRGFLQAVENCYSEHNFYHNSAHAADVACSTVYLTRNGIELCGGISDLEVFALVTSALCHDIAHPGVNNAFLVATSDKLALRYNDQSVLENMHCERTWRILRRDDCNILSTLSAPNVRALR